MDHDQTDIVDNTDDAGKPGISRLAKFEQTILSILRMDLQLHFFYGFVFTIPALFYKPFIIGGILVTILKETFDVLAQKGWSWGDFFFGIAGAAAGLLFLWAAGGL